ncbi:hypothetical protein OA42_10575 [Klebsiella michiganensis]|nr:hypothetical protein OA42_10575 [Klebsiella michiganensis]
MPDLQRHIFIDIQWNADGFLNETLLQVKEDLALNDLLVGTLHASPFVVVQTHKHNRLEEGPLTPNCKRGRNTK